MSTTEFPNVFSVDLEDWYQGIEIDMDDWGNFESRIEQGLNPLLELLQQANTQATFFVLGYQAEKTPGLIKQLVSLGHEIASHGYSHRFVYQQTPEQFRDDCRRSKQLLEDICGCRVEGYRAPYFSITRESLWALDILVEEGYLYDSSIFPVRNYRYGLSDAGRKPGFINTPAGYSLFEVPLSTIQPPIVGHRALVPISGGGYFRLYPFGLTQHLVKRLHAEQMGLIFYMHPWEYDPHHPRIKLKRKLPQFTHYLNLHSSCEKTERLLKTHQFTTMRAAFGPNYKAS